MTLDVLDWRRQVHSLYDAVREEADPARAHRMWCDGRQRLFTSHPASASHDVTLRHAPYDPTLRWQLDVVPAAAQRLDIATGTDGVAGFDRIGTVVLPQLGTLDVWWLASYGGGVWLPARDPSPDTYGGGRYVLDTVKGADLGGADGQLVVDLNFAYNPSCAYDEAWACPLAPPGNRLDVAVAAGELLPERRDG